MPFLLRTGRFMLQLVTFLLLMGVLSRAITFVTAERYTPGVGEPNRLFPLVAVPQPPDAATTKYQLLRWGSLRDLSPAPRFKLPEPSGSFVLPRVGSFEPSVQFNSQPEADGRVRVEVTVNEDDYALYSTYVTDGSSIIPVNFRILGPSSMLLALIPSVVLTWGLSRLVAWWWRRRKAAAVSVQPS
jgi:hypothetical protein